MKYSDIINEIKGIECPTDEVVSRVISVLEEFEPDGVYQIVAEEDNDFINDGIKIYKAYSDTDASPSIQLKVYEGMDDYVAKIIDANIIE
ncbi:MAG: hypothetical protein ACOZCL_06070 [Bacillota bacterium]